MTQNQRWLIAFYALVAVVALVATWGQNLQYVWQADGDVSALNAFLPDTKVNPASRSITIDVGLFLLAAAAFMVIEARRLGVRFVWLYIFFGFTIAISVTFPLFMIARELRIAKQPERGGAWSLTASDVIGLAIVTTAVAAASWFVLS
jgi:hypothetical protein